ncbi:hypothetical protein SISNIDRAFT_494732 [Sistotremastrum niveocremeum HHB9708]|uniref:Uncharacterized protein n=1 Tax=Sistotremastrum niveocremeum HHB9708 TaxID=1314777 RepID=A0A164W6R8_9AGAM|nr:hypothetical protein SISNIDRAFT_494732 [Sistotremastrum niveocremeum HHB9708]
MKRRAESRGESKRPRTLPLPPPNPSPEDNPFTLSSFSSLVQLSTHAQSLASSSSLPRINKSIPLLRAVLAECSSILSTHPDPSVLFAPPRSPPAQSPTSLTPPDERLLRDWGPNPPHPPHSNQKSVEYQPNAFHSLYASSLFYYGYILHHHPSLFDDIEEEEHSAKEYLEAALYVFQASDSIQSSSYSYSHSSSTSGSGEDWQTTINWGRTIVALTLLNPRLCNVTTEDANSTPTPRVHSPNEREGQEQERLGADGGGGLFPPRPHSHLDPAPSSVTSPSPMSNPKIITSDSIIGTGTGTTGTTNTSTSAGTNTGTDVDMNTDVNIVNMDMDIDQERSLPTPSPLPRLASLPLSSNPSSTSTSTSGQGTSTQSLPELSTLRRLKSKSKRVKAKEIPLPHSLPIILPLPESSLPPLPLPLPSTTSPFAYTPTPTSSSFSSSFTFPPSSNTQDVLTIQPTFNPLAPRDDGTVGGGEWREADGREVEQIPSESHTLLSLATDTLTRGIFHLPSSSSPSPSLRLRRWRVLERVARDVGGVASSLVERERNGRAEWATWAGGVLEMVKSEIESAPPLPPQDPTPTPGSDTTMIKREEEEDISMEEHQHEREGEQDDEEDDKEEDYQTSLESLKDRIEETYTHCCLVIASASHAEATLDNIGSSSSHLAARAGLQETSGSSATQGTGSTTATTTASSSPSMLPSLSNLPSLTASGFQLLPTSSMSASLYRSFSSGSDLPLYSGGGGASSSAGAAGMEAREGLSVDAGDVYTGRRRSIVSIADLPPLDQTDAPDTEERKGDEEGRDFRMDHPRKGEGGPISPHSRGRREGRLRVESYLPSPPSSSTPPSVPISLALDAEADVSAATAIDKGEEVRFPTAEEIKESVDREDEKSLDAGSKAGGKKTPSLKLAKGRQTRKRKRSSVDNVTPISPIAAAAGDATPLNTVATTQAGDGGKDGEGAEAGNVNGSTRVLRPRTRDRKRSKQATRSPSLRPTVKPLNHSTAQLPLIIESILLHGRRYASRPSSLAFAIGNRYSAFVEL